MNEFPSSAYDQCETPEPELLPHEPRFVVLKEQHIGIGLRWLRDETYPYPLHLSLALPFVTFEIGLGKSRRALPTSGERSA